MNIDLGDHLYVSKAGYHHHGIYSGSGKVIHYGGFAEKFKKEKIKEVSLSDFLNGNDVIIAEYSESERKYSRSKSVERARSRIGEDGYNLFSNNCEHFVVWCITGDAKSKQVSSAKKFSAAVALRYVGVAGASTVVVGGPTLALAGIGLAAYAGKKAFDFFRNE